jgi:hypothetical protein
MIVSKIEHLERRLKKIKYLYLHILPMYDDPGNVVYLLNGNKRLSEQQAQRLIYLQNVVIYDLNFFHLYSDDLANG